MSFILAEQVFRMLVLGWVFGFVKFLPGTLHSLQLLLSFRSQLTFQFAYPSQAASVLLLVG